MALVLAALAAAAVIVMLRLMFDRRPAVGVGPDRLELARLGGVVNWEEIAGAHLRWTKRRALWVIPFNSPELVLDIPKDAPFLEARRPWADGYALALGRCGRSCSAREPQRALRGQT